MQVHQILRGQHRSSPSSLASTMQPHWRWPPSSLGRGMKILALQRPPHRLALIAPIPVRATEQHRYHTPDDRAATRFTNALCSAAICDAPMSRKRLASSAVLISARGWTTAIAMEKDELEKKLNSIAMAGRDIEEAIRYLCEIKRRGLDFPYYSPHNQDRADATLFDSLVLALTVSYARVFGKNNDRDGQNKKHLRLMCP